MSEILLVLSVLGVTMIAAAGLVAALAFLSWFFKDGS